MGRGVLACKVQHLQCSKYSLAGPCSKHLWTYLCIRTAATPASFYCVQLRQLMPGLPCPPAAEEVERGAVCAAVCRRLTGLRSLRLADGGPEVGAASLRELSRLSASLTWLDLEGMHEADNSVMEAVSGPSGHLPFSCLPCPTLARHASSWCFTGCPVSPSCRAALLVGDPTAPAAAPVALPLCRLGRWARCGGCGCRAPALTARGRCSWAGSAASPGWTC